MMRTRGYTVASAGVSVSAVQDLIALYASSSAPLLLEGYEIGQVTLTGIAMLKYSVKRIAASVTPGSGGSAVTPRPDLSGDSAATFTARANDTTQALGTAVVLDADAVNVVNGTGIITPPYGRVWSCKANEALILSLDTAPASTVMSVTAYAAEAF